MSSRSVANVNVSFGMVIIGLKLYLTANAEQVSFCMINPSTNNRVSQKLVDKITGEEIERTGMSKGFEISSEEVVVFTEDEIEKLQADKKNFLEIREIIDCDQIDPLRVEKTFYTAPDKGMDGGYQFLYKLLSTYNRAAVGIWVSRGKENLVAIRPYKHGLIIQQLYFDTEMRAFENKCAQIEIGTTELALGKVLLDTLYKSTFDTSKYRDTFIDQVKVAVDKKRNGGKAITSTAIVPVVNFCIEKSLRASLEKTGMDVSVIESLVNCINKPSEDKPKAKRSRKLAKAS